MGTPSTSNSGRVTRNSRKSVLPSMSTKDVAVKLVKSCEIKSIRGGGRKNTEALDGIGDVGETGAVSVSAGASFSGVMSSTPAEENMEVNENQRYDSEASCRSRYDDWEFSVSGTDDEIVGAMEGRVKKSRRSGNRVSAVEVVAKGLKNVEQHMQAVFNDMLDCLMVEGVPRSAASQCLKIAKRYEAMVMVLVEKNGRLEEQLKSKGSSMVSASMPPPVVVPSYASATAQGVPVAVVPRPPKETWSAVIRSKNSETHPEEIVEKVLKEVAPTLNVRVHGLRPIKAGGAVLRTPSEAELNKVVSNPKFGEVGLEVGRNPEKGMRIAVQGVHCELSVDEFMTDLMELNLKEFVSPAIMSKVKMVSKPWTAECGQTQTVVLEMPDEAASKLLANERVYVKWFSFRIRSLMPNYGCHRCLSFDHRVAECRLTQEVCRRCGEPGHLSFNCKSEPKCRNCAFKGQPNGHLMMSLSCPIYALRVARDQSRH